MTTPAASPQDTTHPAAPKRSLWPAALIGWFVIFIGGVVAFSSFAIRQPIDLVSSDYYERELKHEQQMDRVSRTIPLKSLVHVAYEASSQSIAIQLPATHGGAGTKGSIQLYRPSNAKLDRQISLNVGADGIQKIDARGLAAGLWKVQVTWKVGAVEFFVDEPVVLDGRSKAS